MHKNTVLAEDVKHPSPPWTTDGRTFSDRVWKQKAEMVDFLHTEMTRMAITGETPKRLTEELRNKFGVSLSSAKRLVNTETAHLASVANKKMFEDLGVERYEILAEIDGKTSDICRILDGQVFELKYYEEGVTAPPFHVSCRTITAPWFEDDDVIKSIKPFYDNTDNWKVVLPEKAKMVEDLTEFTINGTKYKVDGKHVVLDYSKEEKEIANLIARTYGKIVQMVPRVLKPSKVRTADYVINGEFYDLKSPTGSGKNTIYDGIKSGKGQSSRFILNLDKTDLSISFAEEQMYKIFRSKHTIFVDEIVVLKGGKVKKVFKRK